MRASLVLHLAALVITNWLFGRMTSPVADWLNLLLWLAFIISATASLWIFSHALRRGNTFMKRAFAFLVAWLAFYFLWSWGVIFATRIIFARMIRATDEAFLMYAS